MTRLDLTLPAVQKARLETQGANNLTQLETQTSNDSIQDST